MSSATSIKSPANADASLRPWQFFLLAGMLCATGVVIVATGQSPASIIVLSLTVVAASLVAVGAHRALGPLVGPQATVDRPTIVGRARAALEREKALVLRSIKELEFDFAMGKVAKSDFDEMSARLRARAIRLMRQLDASEGYKDAIEREVQARIAGSTAGLKPRAPETPDNAPVARDFLTAEASAEAVSPAITASPTAADGPVMCECGVANDPDARFCKHCGNKLSAS